MSIKIPQGYAFSSKQLKRIVDENPSIMPEVTFVIFLGDKKFELFPFFSNRSTNDDEEISTDEYISDVFYNLISLMYKYKITNPKIAFISIDTFGDLLDNQDFVNFLNFTNHYSYIKEQFSNADPLQTFYYEFDFQKNEIFNHMKHIIWGVTREVNLMNRILGDEIYDFKIDNYIELLYRSINNKHVQNNLIELSRKDALELQLEFSNYRIWGGDTALKEDLSKWFQYFIKLESKLIEILETARDASHDALKFGRTGIDKDIKTNWKEHEERTAFELYAIYRGNIIDGSYPTNDEITDFIYKNNANLATKKYFRHNSRALMMRLKNIAANDELVKHTNVLRNFSKQTFDLSKELLTSSDIKPKKVNHIKLTSAIKDERLMNASPDNDRDFKHECEIFEYVHYSQRPVKAYRHENIVIFSKEYAKKALFMYLWDGLGGSKIDIQLTEWKDKGWVNNGTLALCKINTSGICRGILKRKIVSKEKAISMINELVEKAY